MKERIVYIDNAKGILILLVVIGHILIVANSQYNIIPYSLAQEFIYSFHMPAFFIISGLLINPDSWKKKSVGSFFISKFKTLIVPYMFFEIIAILYKHFLLGEVTIVQGLTNMVTFRCNVGADWFLPAMFVSSMLFYGYTKYQNKILWGFIALLCLFSTWYMPKNNWCDTICRGMLGFGFIYIGSILAKYLTEFQVWKLLLSFVITFVSSALTFKFFTNDFYSCSVENPLIFVVGGICGTYLILGISKYVHVKLLRLLGENSIVILGTHQLVLYTVHSSSSFLWIVGIFFSIVVIEIALIFLLNRFCPFLIGKTKKEFHNNEKKERD
jgi:fucose 4-O-acetylase-like acetyltransferase